jgi:peptidoglycan/xylan/chitin deacetylase (PgdA/CDA1 family)
MLNAFTVDVEEYFHPSEVGSNVSFAEWSSLPSRVEIGTGYILDLLAEFEVQATFFILGWVASKRPALIRRIAEAGHEIACHSHRHRLVYELSPAEFKKDTLAAVKSD